MEAFYPEDDAGREKELWHLTYGSLTRSNSLPSLLFMLSVHLFCKVQIDTITHTQVSVTLQNPRRSNHTSKSERQNKANQNVRTNLQPPLLLSAEFRSVKNVETEKIKPQSEMSLNCK